AGTFTGHDVVTQNSPSSTTLDDSQIRTLLNAEISAQHVPGPTADRLYVFFTAPGTVVTVNGKTSGANFLGYHSQFTNSAGASITYAVIPYAAPGFLNPFQLDTIVLSHEIAESVTN